MLKNQEQRQRGTQIEETENREGSFLVTRIQNSHSKAKVKITVLALANERRERGRWRRRKDGVVII